MSSLCRCPGNTPRFLLKVRILSYNNYHDTQLLILISMQCPYKVYSVAMVNFTAGDIPSANKQDEGLSSSSPYAMLHVSSDPGFNIVANGNEEQQVLLRCQSEVLNEQQLQPEFDIQPSVDRIPGSSYNSEDHTTFSWVNITG